jgi:Na+-translocating ferredoxin:NAD+ oxidoreductase RnfE subunit
MHLATCVTCERILFVSYTYTLYKENMVGIFYIIKLIRVVPRPYSVLVTLNNEVYSSIVVKELCKTIVQL